MGEQTVKLDTLSQKRAFLLAASNAAALPELAPGLAEVYDYWLAGLEECGHRLTVENIMWREQQGFLVKVLGLRLLPVEWRHVDETLTSFGYNVEAEYEAEQAQITYRYRLSSTGNSSAKYGPCEVCGKHASEVFSQSEEREYEPGQWTGLGCHSYFGHKECLEGKRRGQGREVFERWPKELRQDE
ncbi:MAG: hypothetical protein KJ077_11100 [Anaerolineae bacterium]|nr:hypothetical protein [Anaerolineae bacterium]